MTRMTGTEGVIEICDFMPIARSSAPSRLMRRIRGLSGRVHVHVRCAPRLDYARSGHELSIDGTEATAQTPDGSMALRLTSTAPLARHGSDITSDLELRRGSEAWFVLEDASGAGASSCQRCGEGTAARGASPLTRTAAEASLRATVRFWRRWISTCTYQGPWRDAVRRSALALKLLQFHESGAIIAAPTFGLPELVGGARNWDFRYSWIRDASFTLYALLRIGLFSETRRFLRFLLARCAEAGHPGELQVMYGVDGRRRLPEKILGHLAGYRGSKPVRIGNAAYDQFQLDIYGELIDALYVYDEHGRRLSAPIWRRVREIVDWVCLNWRRPDQGIWEVRAGSREFLYSRVMCWVAVDRAIRLAERRSRPAPLDHWRAAREHIRRDVEEHFWSTQEQCFVGVRNSDFLDASCLVMPLVQFIDPRDPRWITTLAAVERRLVSDSLVRRYDMAGMDTDAAAPDQPTFTICSFWYVECLARAERTADARRAFERLLAHANHLGLFSEDIGPRGEHLGNFPQGLTHLALIGAAIALNEAEVRDARRTGDTAR